MEEPWEKDPERGLEASVGVKLSVTATAGAPDVVGVEGEVSLSTDLTVDAPLVGTEGGVKLETVEIDVGELKGQLTFKAYFGLI